MALGDLDIVKVGANPDEFMSMCIHSLPGKGKTRLIGSGSNVLIIRPPSDRTASIRGGAARNVNEFVVRGWDDMDAVYHHCAEYGERYEWVWFDTISLFQDVGLDDLWEQAIARKADRKKFGLDKQEYGINMHRLGIWLRGMIGLQKFNFGVTAHSAWTVDLDERDVLMPWVQGRNMPDKLCGMMNVVGYLEVKKLKLPGEDKAVKRRVLQFGSDQQYYAKDQFDAFPKDRLVDPTMPVFMEAVNAARAREAAAQPKKTKTTKKRATAKKGK